ncbi:hypothetical protein G7046_g5188 [Stylonectria norvegica]|nr:hypothetical protein G7046_g5188 [Stylonectria norvegica]
MAFSRANAPARRCLRLLASSERSTLLHSTPRQRLAPLAAAAQPLRSFSTSLPLLKKRTIAAPSNSPKRKFSSTSPSSSSHVCHICKRVYERADHLTRHQRSHKNARPYQCSLCPKRFNRADLLTRHETTHNRDGGTKGRPFIRRNDRAAEACLNCAASKAKCEDQKPCTRCRNKSLMCQTAVKRNQL